MVKTASAVAQEPKNDIVKTSLLRSRNKIAG